MQSQIFGSPSYASDVRCLGKLSNDNLVCAITINEEVAEGIFAFGVFLATSTDDGETWSTERVSPEWSEENPLEHFAPSLAIDDSDDIHVVWKQVNYDWGESSLLYRCKSGDSWGSVETAAEDVAVMNHEIATDTLGNVHMIYAREGENTEEICYIKRGAAWETPDILRTNCEEQGLSIAVGKDNSVHAAYGIKTPPYGGLTWSICYRRKSGGWQSEEILYSVDEVEGWGLPYCLDPSVCTDPNNDVHVSFFNVDYDSNNAAFYMRKHQGIWGNLENISGWDLDIYYKPSISQISGGIAFVWNESHSIRLRVRIQNSWRPITLVNTSSNYPYTSILLHSTHRNVLDYPRIVFTLYDADWQNPTAQFVSVLPSVTTGIVRHLAETWALIGLTASNMGNQTFHVGIQFWKDADHKAVQWWNPPGGATTIASTGNYSVNIGGLSRGTTYYYRAIGYDGSDYYYGDTLSLETEAEPPEVFGTGQGYDYVTAKQGLEHVTKLAAGRGYGDKSGQFNYESRNVR
jgi:hypothetical protein